METMQMVLNAFQFLQAIYAQLNRKCVCQKFPYPAYFDEVTSIFVRGPGLWVFF